AAAPAHVVTDAFAGRPVHAHVKEVGALVVVAVGVATTRVARDAQTADARARRKSPELRVTGQAPDQNDAVDSEVGHFDGLHFLCGLIPRPQATRRLGWFSMAASWHRPRGPRARRAGWPRSARPQMHPRLRASAAA